MLNFEKKLKNWYLQFRFLDLKKELYWRADQAQPLPSFRRRQVFFFWGPADVHKCDKNATAIKKTPSFSHIKTSVWFGSLPASTCRPDALQFSPRTHSEGFLWWRILTALFSVPFKFHYFFATPKDAACFSPPGFTIHVIHSMPRVFLSGFLQYSDSFCRCWPTSRVPSTSWNWSHLIARSLQQR